MTQLIKYYHLKFFQNKELLFFIKSFFILHENFFFYKYIIYFFIKSVSISSYYLHFSNMLSTLNSYKTFYSIYFLYIRFLKVNKSISFGLAFLPKKLSTFTVLRSPHIDKRSREQFRLTKYKKVLHFPIFFNSNNFYILKKSFLFKHGVSIYTKSTYFN